MFNRLLAKKQIKTLILDKNQSNLIYTLPFILAWIHRSKTSLNAYTLRNKIKSPTNIQVYLPVDPISPPTNQTNQGFFTLQELAKYNGKDGNPAYIAVNGIVYDVTNNAAWAAASHFGLTAGKDLTGAFNSCHADQPAILSTLKVVGELVK